MRHRSGGGKLIFGYASSSLGKKITMPERGKSRGVSLPRTVMEAMLDIGEKPKTKATKNSRESESFTSQEVVEPNVEATDML